MTNIIILFTVMLVANLPWLSNRLFYIMPLKSNNKHLGWCLLELIVLYFIVGLLVRYAEQSTIGHIAPQGWEFYSITACLFLVFAFPGFVYKILWK